MNRVSETISKYGACSLSMADLVEVIISNGTKARALLEGSKDPLRALTVGEDMLIHQGLTKTQAQKIVAVIELVKRYNMAHGNFAFAGSPDDTYNYLAPKMKYLEQEHFVVLVLNARNRIIAEKTISIGSATGTVVHPREVFKEAITRNATAVIVAHNHPSGDPRPSKDDNEITKKLVKAGYTLGIPVLDHIIVGMDSYYSYTEEGELKE